MTTIVSRLFQTEADAQAAVATLDENDATGTTVTIITAEGGDTTARMEALDVAEDAAVTYAAHVENGAALAVVRAEFLPFGCALRAIQAMDAAGALDAGVADENRYMSATPKQDLYTSVMTSHPRFLTFSEGGRKRGRMFDALGLRPLSSRKPRRSILSGSPHMSTKLIPLPLLDKQRKRTSASAGKTITSGLLRTVSRS